MNNASPKMRNEIRIFRASRATFVNEERLVLAMIGEVGSAHPEKRADLLATFNAAADLAARGHRANWSKMVDLALRYGA